MALRAEHAEREHLGCAERRFAAHRRPRPRPHFLIANGDAVERRDPLERRRVHLLVVEKHWHHELGADAPHAAPEAEPALLRVVVLLERDEPAVEELPVELAAALEDAPRALEVALIFRERALGGGVLQTALAAHRLRPAPVRALHKLAELEEEGGETNLRPAPARVVRQRRLPQQLWAPQMRVQRCQTLLRRQLLARRSSLLTKIMPAGPKDCLAPLSPLVLVRCAHKVRPNLVIQERVHPTLAVAAPFRPRSHKKLPRRLSRRGIEPRRHRRRQQRLLPLYLHPLLHLELTQIPNDELLCVLDGHEVFVGGGARSSARALGAEDALSLFEELLARLAVRVERTPRRLWIGIRKLRVRGSGGAPPFFVLLCCR
mmetsp:Transcript_9730/g.31866  ORF Transcript_9730/g.31866 Transcript_9730/m.31866 type:complete len:374 (+) Transcript_9730:271-1392(+)